MKFIILLFTLVSVTAFAEGSFWFDVDKEGAKALDGRKVVIEGVIQKISKKIRARDNYSWVELKDPNSDRFVRIKLYTIKRLKRINTIDCKEDEKLRVSGKFRLNQKKNHIGDIYIQGHDKKLKCLKEEKKEKTQKK